MQSPHGALDLSPPGGGANRPHRHQDSQGSIILGASTAPASGRIGCIPSKMGLQPSVHLSTQSPPPSSVTPSAISHHPNDEVHDGTSTPPSIFQQPPPSVNAAAAFIAAAAAAAAAQSSPTSDHESNHTDGLGTHQLDPNRPRIRNRRGRGGRSARSERMSAAIGSGSPRSLSEMSVRGLDLLRYATLAPDGTYRYTFTIG